MKRVYKHIGGKDWPTEGLDLMGSVTPIKVGDIVVIKIPDGTSMVLQTSDGLCTDCCFFNEGLVPCPRITRSHRTMSDYKGHRIKSWTEKCSKILCDGCYDEVKDELIFRPIDDVMENL